MCLKPRSKAAESIFIQFPYSLPYKALQLRYSALQLVYSSLHLP